MKNKRSLRTFKCQYCGRFISNQDFNDNKAFTGWHHEWDDWCEDVREVVESYHMECKKKYDEDLWIINAAELEDGCSVTAGSLDSEAFFKGVEENRKKAERTLDEMRFERVE